MQPNEPKILEAMNRASRSLIKDKRGTLYSVLWSHEDWNIINYCFTADQQIPWLGAGVGIILGVIVVIADYVFTNKPTLTVLICILYSEIIIKRIIIKIICTALSYLTVHTNNASVFCCRILY